MLRTTLLATLLCALTPSLAHAQLYSWKDASGRLVISDAPKDSSAKVYAVAYIGNAYAATKQVVNHRAPAYDGLIALHASKHALNPDFVRAVIQAESAFNPDARSPKGAMGLMQLMPSTAAVYQVTDAYDPAQNIRAGVAYLKSLMTRFNDDVSLALAAYNAGPRAVERYGNAVPPYKETRNYVARIKGNSDAAHAIVTGDQLYQVVTVVDGHRTVKYYDKPRPGAILVVR
ncbi:MAG TPA: transglycosylase SLT domain-containing protein [Vicinamibacterales bacterium]